MWRKSMLAVGVGCFAVAVAATEAGHIKVAKGAASVQRGSESIAAVPGMKVFAADVITTGADSAVGITFLDNSLISTGPNSVLSQAMIGT